MTVVICLAAAALGYGATLGGQARLTFDVASIRPSGDQAIGTGQVGLTFTNQQMRIAFLSLSDYLAMAYEVPRGRVTGPDWLGSARFDISATMPAGAGQAQLPALMKNLLEDRFQLKAHTEQREFPVYALEVRPGGHKLTRSADQSTPGTDAPVTITAGGSAQGVAFDMGGGSSFRFSGNAFEGKKLTFAQIADTLTNFLDRPVVDLTKVEGQFDFTWPVTPEEYQGMLIRSAVNNGVQLPPQALRILDTPGGGGIGSLLDALNSVGLSLQQRRAPLKVVVVDSIAKAPTAN